VRKLILAIPILLVTLSGCTAESTRLAIQNERKANAVDMALYEREHQGLSVYIFRDTVAQMKESGGLNAQQIAILNNAWNDRDLLEFWAVQKDRIMALRREGVEAKLYSDQSMIDLLIKQLELKFDRVKPAIAAAFGESMTKSLISSITSQPATPEGNK
jgi:hypothetical protein